MLLLFFPNSPEGFAKASSAMNLALDYLYIRSPQFSLADFADKNIPKFSCICFRELNHYSAPLTCFITLSSIFSQRKLAKEVFKWDFTSFNPTDLFIFHLLHYLVLQYGPIKDRASSNNLAFKLFWYV